MKTTETKLTQIEKRVQALNREIRAILQQKGVANATAATPDGERVLLCFIMSLCLCDHMGDVGNQIERVLNWTGIDVGKWESADELFGILEARGYKTVSQTDWSM